MHTVFYHVDTRRDFRRLACVYRLGPTTDTNMLASSNSNDTVTIFGRESPSGWVTFAFRKNNKNVGENGLRWESRVHGIETAVELSLAWR